VLLCGPGSDFGKDFDSIAASQPEDLPGLFLIALDADTASAGSQWLFAAYVPESAPVRLKMLHASSVDDIKAELLRGLVVTDFHATDKSEFNHAAYVESRILVEHSSAMTADEKVVASERAAESSERATAGAGGGAGGAVPFMLTEAGSCSLGSRAVDALALTARRRWPHLCSQGCNQQIQGK
jgi:hypothetical protein